MRPKQPGLSDEAIDMVQNYLDTIPNAMNFEHIDGFFCALICGPEPVPAHEYLPYIFGGEMPRFSSQKQANDIMAALSEHWDHIDKCLQKGTVYYPFLYADKDDKCSANDWADAFMLGVQLREAGWADLINDSIEDPLLDQIIALRNEISDLREGKGHTISGQDRENMVKGIVLKLQLMYNHYADQRAKNQPAPQH